MGEPLVGEPLIGLPQSFIVWSFLTKSKSTKLYEILKSKFARTMLGILKVTQDNNPETWSKVPSKTTSTSTLIGSIHCGNRPTVV